MSVHTGIGPAELLALDADMFDALVDAADRHWPAQLELAAQSLEVQHGHMLAFMAVHSKKGAALPEPITVPRPEQREEKKPERMTIGELAAMPGLTADLRSVD